MSQDNRRPAVLAVLVAVTVLSSGLAGVAFADGSSTPAAQTTDSTDDADGEEVVDTFIERIETLETVEFTRTTETEYDGETTTGTQRVVADLNAFEKRVETLESSYGTNTTMVVNETTSVTYNPDENTVSKFDYRSDRLLPQLQSLTNESAVDYHYEGTDTVAGTDVYVLTGEPTQAQYNNDANVSVTVAVDTETYFPVQITSAVDSEDMSFSTTQTYTNVSLNEEVPESAFELDVPSDATEPSFGGPEVTSYDDYDALQSDAELSVPGAELPGDYEFEDARTIDGDNYYTAMLTYTNGEERIHVSTQADSPFDWSEDDDYEQVTVGDETGYYADFDEYAFLHVDTDSQSYTVHGQLTKDELTDIGSAVIES